MNEIETKVKQIIARHLGVAEEEIQKDSHLQDDLNADPLGMADMVVSLEDEFKIEIPAEESQKFQTVEDIVTYIADILGEV